MDSESKPSLDSYKRDIEELFDSKSDLPISNSETAHAAALYELFFKKANSEMLVFCKNADKNVFDDQNVKQQIEAAAKRNVAIKVVVQHDKQDCESLEALNRYKNLEIKYASEGDAASEDNFCVVDKRAFRYEKDKEHHVAFARMFDTKNAGQLRNRFGEIWSRSK